MKWLASTVILAVAMVVALIRSGRLLEPQIVVPFGGAIVLLLFWSLRQVRRKP